MINPIGFAIIGAGIIGKMHADALRKLDNAALVGIFDANAAAAKKFAEEYGCRAYQSMTELLQDSAIQAVTIAVPSGLHGKVAVAAAEAGKHILCEKPLDLTVERVDAMLSAAEKYHVLLSPILQCRFAPDIQLVKNAMRQGRFGRMVLASASMRWFREPSYYSSSTWRGTWALDGGGALMNQAIHLVDQLIYLNGDVSETFAFSGTLTHSIEVEDSLCASLRYRNGSFGSIEVSTSCAPGFPRRLEFSGSEGSVVLEADRITRWEFQKEQPEDTGIRGQIAERVDAAGGSAPERITSDGHQIQIQDFAEAIQTGRRPLIDAREGRRAIELICGIYRSAADGTPTCFVS